ncbi:diguanylate cyclase [Vibrio vulnificus]|nr:diguanylate cyclase [Vibrio vulnificus]
MKIRKLLGILILTSAFFAALIAIYYQDKYQDLLNANIENTAKEALNQLSYTEREYNNLYDQVASVLQLLTYNQTLTDFVVDPNPQSERALMSLWESVVVNQKWYTEIRLLDTEGMEQLRLNYDVSRNYFFPAAKMQNDANEAYFVYAKTLENSEIGAWGITLDTRDEQLIKPYVPVISIFTPVTIRGERKGYLALNLNVDYIADRLNYSPVKDFDIEIVNDRGYFVISEEEEKQFGDLLPERAAFRFSDQYPQAWLQFRHQKAGYSYDEQDLVVHNSVSFGQDRDLYLLIDMDQQQLMERSKIAVNDLTREALFVLCLILVVALPSLTIVLHYRQRNLESKLARAALNGMTAVMISDTTHRIILVNHEFEVMFGHQGDKIEGKSAQQLIFLNDELETVIKAWSELQKNEVWEGEIRCQTKLNHIITVIMRIQAVKNSLNQVSYYITSLVDISARKELEERLRNLSERDELTQIWNRRKFEQQLAQHTSLIERYPATPMACLALVDIDYFKRVNDEQGHDEGDRVIREVAKILQNGLRNTDVLARVGGEEFAIIMPHTTVSAAEVVLNRLRVAVSISKQVDVTISVGYTELTSNSTLSYKCADIALYDSKSSGRNKVSLCYNDEDLA